MRKAIIELVCSWSRFSLQLGIKRGGSGPFGSAFNGGLPPSMVFTTDWYWAKESGQLERPGSGLSFAGPSFISRALVKASTSSLLPRDILEAKVFKAGTVPRT